MHFECRKNELFRNEWSDIKSSPEAELTVRPILSAPAVSIREAKGEGFNRSGTHCESRVRTQPKGFLLLRDLEGEDSVGSDLASGRRGLSKDNSLRTTVCGDRCYFSNFESILLNDAANIS